MKGFDDKALILFPSLTKFDNASSLWCDNFRTALLKLKDYLKERDIAFHAFYTDDVARKYDALVDVWVSSLSKPDLFFASRNCEGMSNAMTRQMIQVPELYEEIARKDMVEPKASAEERFAMVLRHDSAACTEIIKTYKIVWNFAKKSSSQYKVKSTSGDNRLVITVDPDTLQCTAVMSGSKIDITDVLQLPSGARAINLWEV